MQLPIFFEENLPTKIESFELSPQTSKHVSQVLRMKPGDHLVLTDGNGIELTVKIVNPDKKKTIVEGQSRRHLLLPANQNAIAISPVKNDSRFEWFIEKATELGIHKIFPLITERTQKKFIRTDRLKNIMVSAMIQSRQYFLPGLSAPVSLSEVFALREYDQKLIAHCLEDDAKTELTDVMKPEASKLILIGPEGDFTPDEITQCLKNEFIPVSLGPTRLRTETAGIAAAVLLSVNRSV